MNQIQIMGGFIYDAVMQLLETFSNQRHSGASAHIVLSVFEKLARYENLTNLTYSDDQFSDNIIHGLFQNKRNSAVFREVDKYGNKYYTYQKGVIFKQPDGVCFTGSCDYLGSDDKRFRSTIKIKDTTKPLKTFYIDVEFKKYKDRKETIVDPEGDWWKYWIKDPDQLKQVEEYYDLIIY